MGFKQIRKFTPSKMGKVKGRCLENVRKGFGITTGTYPSAKADMQAQRKAGTLHTGTPPTSIACAVYCDTTSQYEHVVAWDHGTVYEDGYKRATGLAGLHLFGWGEFCDGQRVIEITSTPGFLPAKGYWTQGDQDPRIGTLDAFLAKTFPGYFPKEVGKLPGNYYGPTTTKWIREFQRRTGLVQDGSTGPLTYKKLQEFGFKG